MEVITAQVHKFVDFLPKLGIGMSVFLIFLILSWAFKKIMTKKIRPRTKNPLLADFFGKAIALIVSIIGFVVFLEIIGLGSIATQIVAGAGITTFIIGFAFKDIGENFLSGILLAFKSPFNIGDLIETGNTIGYVSDLNLRQTIIKTLDGKDVHLPNSQIFKNELSNYTIDGYLRYEITFGLDYNCDIQRAMDLITETASQFSGILTGDKQPIVIISDLLASTINLKLLYWIDTFNSKSKSYHLKVKSELTLEILNMLNKNGFYMPSDIVEIKNYKHTSFSYK